jgi:hypothetical protein
MAKDKVGTNPERYENSPQENYKNSEIVTGKEYIVVCKRNASHEVYVGGELLRFEANIHNPVYPEKYSKGVPESIINHPDFQSAIQYFTIIEK